MLTDRNTGRISCCARFFFMKRELRYKIMSSTPIFYSSTDTEGPGLNLSGNAQNRLKQILKACLVDGYGDKPAAGWEMVHEHPQGFSLTNGTGYINFVSDLPRMNASQRTIHMYSLSNITDTSNAILEGDGLCSGSYRKDNPDTGSRHSTNLMNGNVTKWIVLADARTFSIFVYGTGSYAGGGIYAGSLKESIDGFNPFICLGGWYASYNDYNYDQFFSHSTSAVNPFTGALDLSVSYPYAYMLTTSSKTANPKIPFPTINASAGIPDILLLPDYVIYSGKDFGMLRGISIAYPYAGGSLNNILTLLGNGSPVAVMEPVYKDGQNYAQAHWSAAGLLLTDNPEFW